MKSISLDNGINYYSGGQERAVADVIIENWEAIVNFMDDDARERSHAQFEGGDELDFLNLYLSLASEDLILP
jgi:hypothetical protein